MGNEAPGSEQRRNDPNSQGTSSPGSQDRKRGNDQMEQAGRRNQQGGAQQQDKENDRSKSGAQRPD